MKKKLYLFNLLFVFILFSCPSPTVNSPIVPGIPSTPEVLVNRIELLKKSVKIGIGQQYQFTAKVYPENATNKKIIWSSDGFGNINVTPEGIVTGINKLHDLGKSKIIVTSDDGNSSVTIDVEVVSAINVTSVTLSTTNLNLKPGETRQLNANVLPSSATNKLINWTSSDTSIASVDSLGLVTAKSVGSVNIIATTQDGLKTVTSITYVAIPVSRVEFNTAERTISATMNLQLDYKVFPENATNKVVNFTSSNPSILSVDTTGLLTAHIEGSSPVTITYSSEDGSVNSTLSFNVTAYTPVTTLEVKKYNELAVYEAKGEEVQLNIIFNNGNIASDKRVSITSSDPSVADVVREIGSFSEEYYVKSKSIGSTILTFISMADTSITTTLAVNVIGDSTKPRLKSVYTTENIFVNLKFSEEMNRELYLNKSNYNVTINREGVNRTVGILEILAVDNKNIKLKLNQELLNYDTLSISVNNVKDLSGNLIDSSYNSLSLEILPPLPFVINQDKIVKRGSYYYLDVGAINVPLSGGFYKPESFYVTLVPKGAILDNSNVICYTPVYLNGASGTDNGLGGYTTNPFLNISNNSHFIITPGVYDIYITAEYFKHKEYLSNPTASGKFNDSIPYSFNFK